jgi:hypothetical protein
MFNQNKHYFEYITKIASGQYPEYQTWDENKLLILYNVMSILKPHPRKKELIGDPEVLEVVQTSIRHAIRVCLELDIEQQIKSCIASSKNQKMVSELEGRLLIVQNALELLANTYTDDEPASDKKVDDADEDDNIEMDDDIEFIQNMNGDEEMEQDFEIIENEEVIDTNLNGLLNSLSVFANIKIAKLPDEFKNVGRIVYAIRACVFAAFSNILEKTSLGWYRGNKQTICDMWNWLFGCAITETDSKILYNDGSYVEMEYVTEITENVVTALCIIARKVWESQDFYIVRLRSFHTYP